MKLNDIHQYFQNPSPTYLNQELAVCYILSVLLEGDSYGTELAQVIERDYPAFRISDTVLYAVFQWLESEGLITKYWKKTGGRGRPREIKL